MSYRGESCKSCMFAALVRKDGDENDATRFCRRYPPKPENGRLFGQFALVSAVDGWCGEYEQEPR